MPEFYVEPAPFPLRDYDYVPLVPWRCTVCLSFGHVEASRYRWQTIERAWTAHERADPICCSLYQGKYVFVEKEPEE